MPTIDKVGKKVDIFPAVKENIGFVWFLNTLYTRNKLNLKLIIKLQNIRKNDC